eukprot:CAMPEP_0173378032 /NCGR_PEP_ID=MMETSP1356-20130122/1258_1 /TAXON_ID=77927 ORGANISM="Hemiselmis virescens, Strain PCC157" /NCGR_SAMPLE_ID=MMETSP1356 /ASSEMBLY_ACC=CAM_ASM_000847 /LENGTH=99 /DNA_ID=CAMNT_0014330979 /DNA_START=703 /DNA_END=999 /DNA_ORIENTATION=-
MPPMLPPRAQSETESETPHLVQGFKQPQTASTDLVSHRRTAQDRPQQLRVAVSRQPRDVLDEPNTAASSTRWQHGSSSSPPPSPQCRILYASSPSPPKL